MTVTSAAPLPAPTPVVRRRNAWNVAALLTLTLGTVLLLLAGAVVALVTVYANAGDSVESGWNVVAVLLLIVMIGVSGLAGIPALIAAVLAAVGLIRRGRNAFGITLLVVGLFFSLQLVLTPQFVACYPSCF